MVGISIDETEVSLGAGFWVFLSDALAEVDAFVEETDRTSWFDLELIEFSVWWVDDVFRWCSVVWCRGLVLSRLAAFALSLCWCEDWSGEERCSGSSVSAILPWLRCFISRWFFNCSFAELSHDPVSTGHNSALPLRHTNICTKPSRDPNLMRLTLKCSKVYLQQWSLV